MNFFAEQDKARRNTSVLVALMIIAVVSLIAITTVALSLLVYFTQMGSSSVDISNAINSPLGENAQQFFRSEILLWASAVVVIVVSGASFYKLTALSGGGYKVAQALGGRVLPPGSQNPNERKILNVVEEMAVASGNPVPPVYVLDEDSINAFAAGTTRRNAVIGVTRGCVNLLSREELQGVIAHEFSHIHNGDMRLNLRLVAVLHGILIIGLLGSFLLRSSAYSSFSSRRSKNTGAQLGAGLTLFILGYCGVFFGSMIKAAVSRQREFLADASAVQFTRNPQGIANALKKIGGLSSHALLENPKAQEYSHFYFGQGIVTKLGSLTATHPPLNLRIRRIDKSWNGQFIPTNTAPKQQEGHDFRSTQINEAASGFNSSTAHESDGPRVPPQNVQQPSHKAGNANGSDCMEAAELSVAQVGNPEPMNLEAAIGTLQQIEGELLNAAREPFSARALIYGLLLDTDSSSINKIQIDIIKAKAHPVTFKEFCTLGDKLKNIAPAHILPLLECAMPAIKQQSGAQYKHFKSLVVDLIKADKKVSLLEWCLFRTITSGYENPPEDDNKKLKAQQEHVNIVISSIIYSGNNKDPQNAFKAAKNSLSKLDIRYLDSNQITFQALDSALMQLCQVRPLEKPTLLKALAACIYSDGKATPKEQLMFRAIADALNCPVPLTQLEANAA